MSDSWTSFTQFTLLSEKPPEGFFVLWEETDKTASDIQARSFMARTLELCETIPKVQCSQMSSIGIRELSTAPVDSSWLKANPEKNFNNLRLDAVSIPRYVIKKGRCHGARHGKTEEQKVYHIAWNAWKRCCKRVDSQGEHFHRFSRSLSQ